jgi:hypothetical protein
MAKDSQALRMRKNRKNLLILRSERSERLEG